MNDSPSCHSGTVREAARTSGLKGVVSGGEGAGRAGDGRAALRQWAKEAAGLSASPGPLAGGETKVRPGQCGCGTGAPGATQNASVTLFVSRRIKTSQVKTLSHLSLGARRQPVPPVLPPPLSTCRPPACSFINGGGLPRPGCGRGLPPRGGGRGERPTHLGCSTS